MGPKPPKKKIVSIGMIAILCIFLLTLTACSSQNTAESDSSGVAGDSTEDRISVDYDDEDTNAQWDDTQASHITFSGDSMKTEGNGVSVVDNVVTILSAGTYVISGAIADAQIIVYTEDKNTVRLILNGVDMTCSTSAPIYVLKSEKTVITLADGTKNTLKDGSSYTYSDPKAEEPDAVIFSKSDLTINGSGSLNVKANFKNGITSKDELRIVSGNISVDAVNNGIIGRDFLTVKDGNITVNAGDDGFKSSNDADAAKGFILIEAGTINITAGDDGMHSDATLDIYAGEVTIAKSYEGIESAVINIHGGDVNVKSSDDGINGAGGTDSSSVNGRPGQNDFASSGDCSMSINGGTIVVDSGGDGIDINGSVTMTDGKIIVNGPTDNGNGALDYTGSFTVTGGFLVAAGSAGMAEAPDTNSSLYALNINLPSDQQAGTIIRIENADGKEVLTFAPTKMFRNLVVCSSELTKGTTYKIYYGGSSSGTSVNGLYSGGTYTPGTRYEEVAISEKVTRVGSYSGGMGGRAFKR
ncbi:MULTISPECIES: carbohydrate-binding domain-containing protein [Dehalobacter]|jgi:hypothetical protein|uniref:Carbohydrate-binding domain-containing protein n=1 Tax=Dehalobacter restrictus TaxID=55583 RepID=A0A857DIA4_9FIRM|nr:MULTISPECIES: carbohydrate-binding domain-containing protein [Dehalobacter]MCG1026022.1 carbohydrate-binding domain-containing protein [Dehalobacter sp.]OCZ50390.1 hypothetical protein A7D23_14980 [Dehalobacter sp. TeCB1]QHA00065.1 carbohydrate-binding domain-containing protein [Dehalobacter restrictus]